MVSVVAMVLATLTALGAGQAVAAPSCDPFPDVNSSNAHCKNIDWLAGQGITKPADGLYHPASSVNRGSMAAFLFRLTHPGKPAPKCTGKPFPDVSTSNVFCGYIQWAVNNGVTKGYPSDGTYRPKNGVTRGAMAAFLQRIVNPGKPAKKCTEVPFVDVTTNETFCGVIDWMAKTGITRPPAPKPPKTTEYCPTDTTDPSTPLDAFDDDCITDVLKYGIDPSDPYFLEKTMYASGAVPVVDSPGCWQNTKSGDIGCIGLSDEDP